jgi:hypothetical protein
LCFLWSTLNSDYNTEDCHGLRPHNDEFWNLAQNTNLKKQSQFAEGLNYVNSYMKGFYGNNHPAGGEKNKAKQTQIQ